MYTRARRRRISWTDGRGRPWSGEHGVRDWGFGGNGWVVPISVACILACFIIAGSTLALLVLYIHQRRSAVTFMRGCSKRYR